MERDRDKDRDRDGAWLAIQLIDKTSSKLG